MLKYLLVALPLVFALPARAADVEAPVQAIMKVATTLWANADDAAGDYFDAANVVNFSGKVQALYAEASKHPAYDTEDGTGSPFDYDPIILGQDGCPLEGVTYRVGAKSGPATDVVVRFKHFTCMEGASDEERNAVSELHFQVVSEHGQPVIADVVSGVGDDRYSLVGALNEILGH